MRKLALFVLAIIALVPAYAQYSAGTLKVSLGLGNSPYVGLLQAPNQYSASQSLNAEGATWVSGTSNQLVNMIGMELKFFVADNLACKFIGGGQSSFTPGQNEIPGVDDDVAFDPQTALPRFADIKEQKLSQYLGQLGFDAYYSKNDVAIYGGLEGGFRYGASSAKTITENAAGTSLRQVYGFHGAIDFGAEYGANEGFFVGVEIRPISVAYNVSTIEPVPGASQSADNITWGFFTFPMLRAGINF